MGKDIQVSKTFQVLINAVSGGGVCGCVGVGVGWGGSEAG